MKIRRHGLIRIGDSIWFTMVLPASGIAADALLSVLVLQIAEKQASRYAVFFDYPVRLECTEHY